VKNLSCLGYAVRNRLQPIEILKRAGQMSPKISVIIPVYNAAAYLPECLDSVVNQTLRELEIICVDDGSTDRSPEVLTAYAARDPRVRVLTQVNQGTGAASNYGLRNAAGEFTCIMAADDFYADDRALEDLYQTALTRKAAVCGGNLVEYENGVRLPNSPIAAGWRDLRDGLWPSGITRFLYDLRLVKDNELYFTTHARAQDTHWLARVLAAARGIYYLTGRDVYIYRIRHKPVDWNRRRRLDLLEVHLESARFMDEQGYPQLADFFETEMWHYAGEFRERQSRTNLRPGTWEYRKNWLRYLRYSLWAWLRRGSKKRHYQRKRDEWAQSLKPAKRRPEG
jgi:glycosyltransferase involved in cell wall biosynthesis